jgi:hypothetical protein
MVAQVSGVDLMGEAVPPPNSRSFPARPHAPRCRCPRSGGPAPPGGRGSPEHWRVPWRRPGR